MQLSDIEHVYIKYFLCFTQAFNDIQLKMVKAVNEINKLLDKQLYMLKDIRKLNTINNDEQYFKDFDMYKYVYSCVVLIEFLTVKQSMFKTISCDYMVII